VRLLGGDFSLVFCRRKKKTKRGSPQKQKRIHQEKTKHTKIQKTETKKKKNKNVKKKKTEGGHNKEKKKKKKNKRRGSVQEAGRAPWENTEEVGRGVIVQTNQGPRCPHRWTGEKRDDSATAGVPMKKCVGQECQGSFEGLPSAVEGCVQKEGSR